MREEIAVLGIPFDKNASFLRGAKDAPRRIRDALFCESTNLWTEKMIDLGTVSGWQFLDDLILQEQETALTQIEQAIDALLNKKNRAISLGGDHSVTYPIIRAYAKRFPDLHILHLDAHPDLYDEFDGNPNSHACPFARIMEENLATRLVQVGIRTLTGHQWKQAQRFRAEIIPMREIHRVRDIRFDGPVYLSIDLDCLDPAFAPGVSHHEPGGMTTRDVLDIIQNVKGALVGADIVEYNPNRDPQGITGRVAAKLLKETIGRMLEDVHGTASKT